MNDQRPLDDTALTKTAAHSSDIEFIRSFLKATAALALSAGVLVSLFLVFAPGQFEAYIEGSKGREIVDQTISGDELSAILGSVEVQGKTLKINNLQKVPDGRRAILHRRIPLSANDYPFLQYEINRRHEGTSVYLFWRKAENTERIFETSLYRSGDGPTILNLSKVENWEGSITEVGINIYGDLRGEPLHVTSLSFKPFSRLGLLRAVWSEWSTVQGWTQQSINHLSGRPERGIVPQTAIVAAWSGGALLILGIACLLMGNTNRISMVLAVLIPWVGLDLMWQRQLSAQVMDTASTFSNKSQHQKLTASMDGALYQYARYLKDEVLPEPGKKIFLLHDSKGHNFSRLRVQHHLLPHNIYNFWKYPEKAHIRKGDYILVLGDIPQLEFDSEKEILRWKRTHHLKVQLIDHHEEGDLYLVVKLRPADRVGLEKSGISRGENNR